MADVRGRHLRNEQSGMLFALALQRIVAKSFERAWHSCYESMCQPGDVNNN